MVKLRSSGRWSRMAGPPGTTSRGNGDGAGRSRSPGGPDAARARLVDELRDSGRLTSPAVEAAFRAVPRPRFLPAMAAPRAYQDAALVIKTGDDRMPVTSSAPPRLLTVTLARP